MKYAQQPRGRPNTSWKCHSRSMYQVVYKALDTPTFVWSIHGPYRELKRLGPEISISHHQGELSQHNGHSDVWCSWDMPWYEYVVKRPISKSIFSPEEKLNKLMWLAFSTWKSTKRLFAFILSLWHTCLSKAKNESGYVKYAYRPRS